MKTTLSFGLFMCALIAQCVPFERMNLHKEMVPEALDAASQSLRQSNNGDLTILSGGHTSGEIPQEVLDSDGITFHVKDDGTINFIIDNDDIIGFPHASLLDRIIVNGITMKSLMNDIVMDESKKHSPSAITNTILDMAYNPLWGKKLAAIGDSFIAWPTHNTSYPAYIAQRNNMTLVHNGRGGEELVGDKTNELGQVTNPSCIHSYTNDIPSDADFILCQIGANDAGRTWKVDVQNNVADTNMEVTTFKGCWNNLLIGLKKYYPNAKIGMILANNWPTDNMGKKTEDDVKPYQESGWTGMIQWQKTQAQKLNIPVFDPVEDTRMFISNYRTLEGTSLEDLDWYEKMKIQMGTSQLIQKDTYFVSQSQYLTDPLHPSEKGAMLMSFFVEKWMKTVLMGN